MIVDIRELNQRAVQATVEIVGTITANNLDCPTPCSQWTVHELLEHQIVQNHGFAFAASGQRSELAMWEPRSVHDDPVGRHRGVGRRVPARSRGRPARPFPRLARIRLDK
jgi:hypothetical protein